MPAQLSNAAAMPEVAAFVAAWRESFPELRVRYAAEAGRQLGRRGPAGVPATQVFVPAKRPARGRA